jgi:hypothetical protein
MSLHFASEQADCAMNKPIVPSAEPHSVLLMPPVRGTAEQLREALGYDVLEGAVCLGILGVDMDLLNPPNTLW